MTLRRNLDLAAPVIVVLLHHRYGGDVRHLHGTTAAASGRTPAAIAQWRATASVRGAVGRGLGAALGQILDSYWSWQRLIVLNTAPADVVSLVVRCP